LARSRVAAFTLLLVLLVSVAPAAAQLTDADVFVAEGILALEDKRYQDALEGFRRALATEPEHLEALYYSGVVHMALKDPEQALTYLERARAKAPRDVSIAFQLGVAYFALEEYDAASPLLEQVFTAEPGLDGIGYYTGFTRFQRGDHQGALRAFRAGRTTDADLAQLTRFYTGLALASLGLHSQAAAEVEQALRLQPASALSGPAERLRDTLISARDREKRFRGELRLGGFFDDNAAVRPDKHATDFLVSDLRQAKHETFGVLASLRLEYDWLRVGDWTSTVSYSFFTTHDNDLPSFNLRDHLLSAGVSRRDAVAGMPLSTGAQFSWDHLSLRDHEFLQRFTTVLYGALVESERHVTTAFLRSEVKEYAEKRPLPTQEFQDGENWMLGVHHVVRFEGGRHFVKGGYQIDFDDTRGRDFDYIGHKWLTGFQYTLPWQDIRLVYDFSMHFRDYRFRHAFLPLDDPDTRERNDHEMVNQVRFEWPVPWRKDLTAIADFQFTNVRSDIPVFTYHRRVVTLAIAWQF
jgi:tetratricopeptide (TPR) repeat protein